MNTTDTPHTDHLQIENPDYESCNHKGPFRVENPRSESSPGTATFSTFRKFKEKSCMSGLGVSRP
jgi:hypothetical protein